MSLYAIDAEKSALGSVLLSPSAQIAVDMLTEDDFYLQDHKAIFAAMKRLRADKRPIDLITVDQIMGGDWHKRLIELSRHVPSSAMAETYARMIKAAANKRKVVYVAESMIQQAQDATVDADEIVAYARGQMRDIAGGSGGVVMLDDAMMQAYVDAERVTLGQNTAIPTGIAKIDQIMGGLHPGELTILAARTAVGKSAMAVRMAVNAAMAGKNVYFVSLEMSTNQICHRLVTGDRFDASKIRNGTLKAEDWISYTDAMEPYVGLPLALDSKTRYVEDVCTEAQTRVDAGKCDLVIVDYAQKLRTREKHSADHLRVGSIVWKLKQLTLDLDIPVVALAQVRRNEGKKPNMEQLKDSGSLEMDADNVILLHTPVASDDESIRKEDMASIQNWAAMGMKYLVVDIAKQRQGPTAIFQMLFDPRRMLYHDIRRG